MADGFDTIPCEPNQSDCQKVSQYTFDTQVGSAYNVSRAIAEQWQVIDTLKQDVDEVSDKTAVKDYNGNIFKNLTLKGENGINVDINEDNPEQLDISLDQDITDQIDINMENIISLENTTDSLDERVTQTETSIAELSPDVARALKTPMVTPTETKLVAVDTTNSQEMLNVGDTLSTNNNTLNLNPTLKSNIDTSYSLDQTITVTDQSKIFIPVDVNKYDYKLVMLLAPNQTEHNTSMRVAVDGNIINSFDRWIYYGKETQTSNSSFTPTGYTHSVATNGYIYLCDNENAVGRHTNINLEITWQRNTGATLVCQGKSTRTYGTSFAQWDIAGIIYNENNIFPNQLVVTSANMADTNLLNGYIRVYKRLAFGQTE